MNGPSFIGRPFLRLFSYLLAGALVAPCLSLPGCTSTKSSESEEVPSSDQLQSTQLKRARRASNVLCNTVTLQMAIFMGSMGGAMADAVANFAKVLSPAKAGVGSGTSSDDEEGSGSNNGALELKTKMDAALKAMDKDARKAMAQLEKKLIDLFDGLGDAKKAEYARIFNHKVLQKGVKIAAKQPKGLGLVPLSKRLTPKDFERYVLLLSVQNPKQDDVVALQASFAALVKWTTEVNQLAKEDKEIERAVSALSDGATKN